MSDKVIHRLRISVKSHFGDVEGKFKNVLKSGVFEDGVFEFGDLESAADNPFKDGVFSNDVFKLYNINR